MYEYILTNGKMNIDTKPFCKELSEVKIETLSHTVDCVHMRSTYPNGFIYESLTYADKIIFRTNRELRDNGDGTFTVLDK